MVTVRYLATCHSVNVLNKRHFGGEGGGVHVVFLIFYSLKYPTPYSPTKLFLLTIAVISCKDLHSCTQRCPSPQYLHKPLGGRDRKTNAKNG